MAHYRTVEAVGNARRKTASEVHRPPRCSRLDIDPGRLNTGNRREAARALCSARDRRSSSIVRLQSHPWRTKLRRVTLLISLFNSRRNRRRPVSSGELEKFKGWRDRWPQDEGASTVGPLADPLREPALPTVTPSSLCYARLDGNSPSPGAMTAVLGALLPRVALRTGSKAFLLLRSRS